MVEDIVPNLLQTINRQFDAQVNASVKMRNAARMLKNSKATYRTANSFAIEAGDILAKVLQRNLTAANLPDQKMYYNIANRVLNTTMKNNFDLISEYSAEIQKLLNDNAEIGVSVQRAVLNQDRIDGLVNLISTEDDFEKINETLYEPVINFCQNIVDESIKQNIGFQAKVGLHPLITRRVTGEACPWCLGLAGTYEYAEAPHNIYQRHKRCRCTVEYDPGSGKRQDVWSKKWHETNQDAKIKETRAATSLPKGREFVKSRHSRIRQSEREVSDVDIKEALNKPIHVDPVKSDELGRKSQRYIGAHNVVVINPDTKKVITTFPTNKRFRNRYGKGGKE